MNSEFQGIQARGKGPGQRPGSQGKNVKRKLEASANRSKAAAYANSWVKDNDDSSFFQKQAKAINKKQKIMARDASNNTISRKNRKKDEWNEMLDAGKKKKVKGDSTVIGVPSVKTGKNKFQQVQEYNNVKGDRKINT